MEVMSQRQGKGLVTHFKERNEKSQGRNFENFSDGIAQGDGLSELNFQSSDHSKKSTLNSTDGIGESVRVNGLMEREKIEEGESE
jgi:hypothetical protein